MMFKLKFNHREIPHWAKRYAERDDNLTDCIGPRARKAGFYRKADFLETCRWKTPRTAPRCAENPEDFIREVTRVALSTRSEQLRIEVLTLLSGVSWPTASVLLHFGHRDLYPILDFRALWSLGIDPAPDYDFGFWEAYVSFCRKMAEQAGVSMRVLDRALWQFSKEHQEVRS